MEKKYTFRDIEKKWQKFWLENNTFKAENKSDKPKYYVLDMFPYPSGAGLHVGHPLGYIASDIYSWYKRLKGFNVLHPMGFDAFGLPAEQYAIESGQHPAITTEKNIKRYKEQLQNIGFSFDWNREVKTCSPSYYKWTQWIFIKLFNSWYNNKTDKAERLETLIMTFEKEGNAKVEAASDYEGNFTAEQWASMTESKRQHILGNYRLAYVAYADVNWCHFLGTVLANDEVKDGKSERGGHPVVRKKMRQWFLRITAYADRLLHGLETIDWTDSLKEMQRNWIGRSEGVKVKFLLSDNKHDIEIFTTRIDTIFGATFIVLAPEHTLVEKITVGEQKKAIAKYMEYVNSRSDVERQQEKKVTGEFTGSFAINPLTGDKIPVWIAEYVLADYGTGAIMAVPADDERDMAFAEKFNLPVTEIIDKSEYPDSTIEDKVGKMINSGFVTGMEVKDAIEALVNKVEKDGIGKKQVNYRMRDAGFSRQRYWGEPIPITFKPACEPEKEFPYPLNEVELPLILPEVESYKPTGDGKSPLENNNEWIKADSGKRETDTMPGYAGSSWYFLRYMDPDNDKIFVSKDAEKYWQNVDLYIGGTEHAVGHLMYARFWHKFLYDSGYISTQEPFQKLINQGMIQGRSNLIYRINGTNKFVSNGIKNQYETTAIRIDVNLVRDDVLDIEALKKWREEYNDAEFLLENEKYICGFEIEKMSKRWHNVVNPDDVIEEYGADCFRMYEMFLGPLEQHKPWDTKGIEGVYRFLRKLWKLFYDKNNNFSLSDEDPSKDELKTIHKTIKKVAEDIERCAFNTGVSSLMICVNELTELKCNKRLVLEKLLVIMAPYAPHICEELWKQSGNEASISKTGFPAHEEQYLATDTFEYPVSFNGKLRFKIELPANLTKEEIEKEVLSFEKSRQWMNGKEPLKVIVVPMRIVNIVVPG